MNGGTLSASIVTGIGKVTLSQQFMDLDALLKKDILSDWIAELTECYESFDCFGNQSATEKSA